MALEHLALALHLPGEGVVADVPGGRFRTGGAGRVSAGAGAGTLSDEMRSTGGTRRRPGRKRLRARVAWVLGCAIAEPDGDGIAHYLVDLRGKKPVDVRPPERWTARALAHRLALDVCDADGTASLSLHDARGACLWVLTAMRVTRVAAYSEGDEHGLVLSFRELPGRVVEVALAPEVSVTIAPWRL